MKKLVLVTLFIAAFSSFSQTAIQPVGSGTQLDPYKIATWENLYWMSISSNSHDKYFKQTADIDFATAVPNIQTWTWIYGTGWTPIVYFTGTYDGQGYKIENLYINMSESASGQSAGLFDSTNGAVLKNMIVSGEIHNISYSGFLSGTAVNTTVINCSGSGYLLTHHNSGGLIACAYSSQISNSCSDVIVLPYSYGYSPTYIGGFIAIADNGTTINNCYSKGQINGGSGLNGGLVSYLTNSNVTKSYSIVNIEGTSDNGGLIRLSSSSTVTASFWSDYFSGQTVSPGGGTHVSTSLIDDIDFYQAAGWDFIYYSDDGINNEWKMYTNALASLPCLSWQTFSNWGPVVNDSWAFEITDTGAKFTAEILDIGNPAASEHGILCYEYLDPESHFVTHLDSVYSAGIYQDSISGLKPNTIYKFRSYAQNAQTSPNGSLGEFRTLQKPSVAIQAVTEISTSGATLNGNLTVVGYPSVTEHGFCVNTYGNPGFGDIVYDLGPRSSTGSFTQQLSGLEVITTYYVKSFAINQADTVFSGEISFTTLDLFAGSGTSESPFEISILADLENLSTRSTYWDKYYIQTADIDADSTSGWNYNEIEEVYHGFSPIGNQMMPFVGNYNGQGHKITDLYINFSPEYQYGAGFFGNTSGAVISNLSLENVSVTGYENTGGLIGANLSYSSVTECSSSGTVSGVNNVGGLVGYNYLGSSIQNSFSAGTVNGTDQNTGGLTGNNNNMSTLTNCYSTAAVNGNSNAGGLTGTNYNSASIFYCYSAGSVTGTNGTGGLVGWNDGTMTEYSFWDTQASGQTASAEGIGKTSAEMKTKSTFTDAEWDFSTVWKIDGFNNGGYPYLKWQVYPLISPQNITIIYSSAEPVISWTNVGAASYNIYSAPDPYAEFPAGWTLEASGLTATSWTDTNASASVKKFYVVVAVN